MRNITFSRRPISFSIRQTVFIVMDNEDKPCLRLEKDRHGVLNIDEEDHSFCVMWLIGGPFKRSVLKSAPIIVKKGSEDLKVEVEMITSTLDGPSFFLICHRDKLLAKMLEEK
ncbi:MAG TPA: hypothetical protein VJZ31_01415 [Bacilli bacterium]|nr:hypothetical protein [Bacilli bacterium]